MKRRRKAWRIAAVCLLAAISLSLAQGCGLLMPEEEADLAPPVTKPAKTEYEYGTAEIKSITRELQASGTLIAVKEESLSFKSSGGVLEKINVTVGQTVEAGDVLVNLEAGDIDNRIRLKQLDIQKQQTKKANLQKSYDTLNALPDEAKPSRKEFDDIQNEMGLISLDIQSLQVELEGLKDQKDNAELVASMGGVITFVENLKPGDTVDAYKPIVVIADPSELRLIYQGDQTSDILLGMQAKVTTRGGEAIDGEVVMTPANVPIDAQATYRNAVVISFATQPQGVKWGEYVDFVIQIIHKDEALVVPKRAVKKFVGRTYVEVPDGEIKKEVDVVIGVESLNETEILQGLSEGDTVVLS